jgi:hypothetical protein
MAPRKQNTNALQTFETTDTTVLKKKSKNIRRIALVAKNALAGLAAAGLQDLAPAITVTSLGK